MFIYCQISFSEATAVFNGAPQCGLQKFQELYGETKRVVCGSK